MKIGGGRRVWSGLLGGVRCGGVRICLSGCEWYFKMKTLLELAFGVERRRACIFLLFFVFIFYRASARIFWRFLIINIGCWRRAREAITIVSVIHSLLRIPLFFLGQLWRLSSIPHLPQTVLMDMQHDRSFALPIAPSQRRGVDAHASNRKRHPASAPLGIVLPDTHELRRA